VPRKARLKDFSARYAGGKISGFLNKEMATPFLYLVLIVLR